MSKLKFLNEGDNRGCIKDTTVDFVDPENTSAFYLRTKASIVELESSL
jgi:hypothetical protein